MASLSLPLPRNLAQPSKAPSRWARKEQNCRGFTLIEVLIAVAILSAGLMGVASLIAQATTQQTRAGHISRGSHLVEGFLEKSYSAQYSAQAFAALTDTNITTVIDGVRFSLNCSLSDNTPVERCKEMTCTLSWNNVGFHACARYIYVLSPKF